MQTILSYVEKTKSIWRTGDNGQKWEEVEKNKGEVLDLLEHPHSKKRAVAVGQKKTHWVTDDEGVTWKEFKTERLVSIQQPGFAFSASNPDHVLYSGTECTGGIFTAECRDTTYYTTDFFKTDPKELLGDTHKCMFTQSTPGFNETTDSTVLCIVDGENAHPKHRKLVISDNWFKDKEEPKLDGINVIEGVAETAAVFKFIVVAVKSTGTDEMALYVTDDAKQWHRAEFPHEHSGLKEDAYTILESTPYSIQVDVLSGHATNPMGTLFTSNSNGTYFTKGLEHTNRAPTGAVDFEKVEGIQGILLANIVDNYEQLDSSVNAAKKVVSRISFDDGKMGTWQPLKAGDDKLHLHSIINAGIGGRVFSSRAPGLVMGVGNTGKNLEEYMDGDLYLSDDAGQTWNRVKKEAHKYEFGGLGSIIIIVNDEERTNKIEYSTDFGKNWKEYKLEKEVRVRLLTTTPDSTSLNFLLVGTDKDKKHYAISLDFSEVLEKKCDKDDFEKWYARYDEDGKPDCLMGHKEYFMRRKKDAQCNAATKLYEEPDAEQEICECLDHDFECDFNYIRSDDGKTCDPVAGTAQIPADKCKDPKDKYKGPSGFRKIPGNNCKDGVDKENEEVERECGAGKISRTSNDALCLTCAVATPPSDGKISMQITKFKGARAEQYFYLDHAETSSSNEEVWLQYENQKDVY